MTSSTASASGTTAPPATTGTGSGAPPAPRRASSQAHHDRPRLGDDAGLAQLELEAHPDRDLAVRVGGEHLVLLVLRADGREPDDPRALARRDLHGDRVEPADGAVERDRPDRVDLRDRLAHDAGALGGRGVVRLQAEAGEAELGAGPPRRGR